MKPKTRRKNRHAVLLAADFASFSMTTMELAVALATHTKTGLRGLYIEDEDLLQLSGLPCSREITLISACERPTSSAGMQRALSLAARQFKENLAQQARAGRLAWRFEQVRGRSSEIGLQIRDDVTYTILGRPRGSGLQRSAAREVRKILLLGRQTPHLQRLMELLLQRMAHGKLEISLLIGEGSDELGVALEALAEQGDHLISLVEVELPLLLEQFAAWQTAFDIAIISRPDEQPQLAELLAQIRCPVILVA